MDPLLDAILKSRDPSALLAEDRLRSSPPTEGPTRPSAMQNVRRSFAEGAEGMSRGLTSDLVGAPVDIINLVLKAMDDSRMLPQRFSTKKPVLGSDWIHEQLVKLGVADPEAKSPSEAAGRLVGGFVNPSGPPMMLGILAGARGARNLGGIQQKRFEYGEQAPKDAPSQELWRDLGYARGADEMGRFEISDIPSRLKLGPGEHNTTLGAALEHPELFAAYPELANMPLRMKIGSMLDAGAYNPATKSARAEAFDPETARSVLLHEVQHGVQDIEGFAHGANMRQGREAYEKSAGEQEAYNVQRRLEDPSLMDFTPEMTEGIPREMQIVERYPREVMEAVKEPGGMWHPEAVERLSKSLWEKLNLYYATPDHPLLEGRKWSDRAIRNYLNKYAGTERDPLKDVEIPFGEGMKRWGELMDLAIGSKKQEGPRGMEDVWNIKERGMNAPNQRTEAIKSYLSHVGDYLRQNVPAEKLQQYDLVRAVKETAANDARVAKEMEKAAAASMKDLPVYKEYPDGMRWVEITAPKTLTESQAATVRKVTLEEAKKGVETYEGGDGPLTPERLAEKYIALDHRGKPIKNSYTNDLAYGETPQDAYLYGRLAEEGNQMGHCVGGYCEDVASGESRIFSLRDAKGRSHVTVEVGTPDWQRTIDWFNKQPEDVQARLKEQAWSAQQRSERSFGIELAKIPEVQAAVQQDILQIKGKQNRAPNAEYLPYVQDFVRSGKWGEVGDIHNTSLKDLQQLRTSSHPELQTLQAEAIKKAFGDARFVDAKDFDRFVAEQFPRATGPR